MKANDTESAPTPTAEVFFRRRSQLASLLTDVKEDYKRRRQKYVDELVHGERVTLGFTEKHLPHIENLRITAQLIEEEIAKLEKQMREASKMLEFEYAAVLRDRIIELGGEGKNKK